MRYIGVYVFGAVVSDNVFWDAELSDPMVKKCSENVNSRSAYDGVDNNVMCKGVNNNYQVVISVRRGEKRSLSIE